MKILDINELLQAHPYPGRGIVLGRSADGQKAVIIYFIMGRSGNSRNRVFEATGDGIRTRAYDESKMVDPSLIIYHPVRRVGEVTETRPTPSGTACWRARATSTPCAPGAMSPTAPTIPPASPAWWTRTAPSACPS